MLLVPLFALTLVEGNHLEALKVIDRTSSHRASKCSRKMASRHTAALSYNTMEHFKDNVTVSIPGILSFRFRADGLNNDLKLVFEDDDSNEIGTWHWNWISA